MEDTYHRVDGVGRQIPSDDGRPFDPRVFEQAIHGLQDMVVRGVRVPRQEDEGEEYDPGHEHATDEDGDPVIRVADGTMLKSVLDSIPRGWDISVLADQMIDTGYAVRCSVDCGGDVLVYATYYVQNGLLSKFHVAHTDLIDRDEVIEVTDFNRHSSGREVAHLVRYLERVVMEAYAATISNAAPAFDYIGSKDDIPAIGKRPASTRERRMQHSQKEWSEIRGKTQQTVSDNVRTARRVLDELPDYDPFTSRGQALIQMGEDTDYQRGDIRLV